MYIYTWLSKKNIFKREKNIQVHHPGSIAMWWKFLKKTHKKTYEALDLFGCFWELTYPRLKVLWKDDAVMKYFSSLKLSTQQAFTRSRDIGVLSAVNTNSSNEAFKNKIVKCIMYMYIYIYKYQIWIWCIQDSYTTKFSWT